MTGKQCGFGVFDSKEQAEASLDPRWWDGGVRASPGHTPEDRL